MQFVSVIRVNKLSGLQDCLLGVGAEVELLFQDLRLIERNGMYREIANAGQRFGKRELFYHREQARQHLGFSKAREPQVEIELVSHKVFGFTSSQSQSQRN